MKGWLIFISDVFSVITIALCLILKVPQIYRIFKSGQAAGLNFNALLLELSSYTVTFLYNYCNEYAPLSYLEYPILIIQEYVLIGLVMHYKNFKATSFPLLILTYLSISLVFALRLVDKFILTFLMPFTTPVGAISKIMQLMEIIRRKNANSVSVFTWFLSFFTNFTRIYTVYMDSADLNILMNLTVSSVLSGSVMIAALYYQRLSKNEMEKVQ